MQVTYQLNHQDRVLQKTPFSFDVSVWEFFWPLICGSQLVIARPGEHQDPAALLKTIAEKHITTLHFVPSMLDVFLATEGLEKCNLKRVMCSGEALSYALKERFYQKISAQLHNLYGPTEAAIDVTAWDCSQDVDTIVPIGKPIANVRVYILNSYLMPVPIGVAGELYIGGIALAQGT